MLTDESMAAARRRFGTLGQIEAAARAALASPVWDLLAGAAGDEETLRDNRDAFGRWRFRPRALPGTGGVDLAVHLLGLPLAAPLLVAPFAPDGLFHPDGQPAVAAACAFLGLTNVAPTTCSYPLEEVRAAGARLFQLPPTDPAVMRWLIARAAKAGYDALVVTVDQPVLGWRDRDRADPPAFDRALTRANFAVPGGPGPAPRLTPDSAWLDWTWDALGDLLREAGLPFVVKGVLTAEDAMEALRIGAAAVVVSNHGGRQLDGAPASLDQLPEVAGAVGGRIPVLLDSGVRRGSDVVKALALGADAVLIGRTAAYGLAAAGAAGVARALELILAEMRTVLALVGCRRPAELDRTRVQPSARL